MKYNFFYFYDSFRTFFDGSGFLADPDQSQKKNSDPDPAKKNGSETLLSSDQGFRDVRNWGGYGSGSENFFPGAGSGTSPAPEDEDKAFLHIF